MLYAAARRKEKADELLWMNYVADALQLQGKGMYPVDSFRDIVARRDAPEIDAEVIIDSLIAKLEGGGR